MLRILYVHSFNAACILFRFVYFMIESTWSHLQRIWFSRNWVQLKLVLPDSRIILIFSKITNILFFISIFHVYFNGFRCYWYSEFMRLTSYHATARFDTQLFIHVIIHSLLEEIVYTKEQYFETNHQEWTNHFVLVGISIWRLWTTFSGNLSDNDSNCEIYSDFNGLSRLSCLCSYIRLYFWFYFQRELACPLTFGGVTWSIRFVFLL